MVDTAIPISIPDHRLIRQIGGGGYGTVWLAQHLITNVHYAAKIVPKDDPNHRAFIRDIEGISTFQRAGKSPDEIVQIFHVGQNKESFYYVMELADDARMSLQEKPMDELSYEPLTLKHLLASRGAISPALSLDIIEHVLTALQFLHSREPPLIHRDVKPSNVLFISGRPKLADLGLVTSINRDISIVGTPGYMPLDVKMDQSWDVFAVGIMSYEMITGWSRDRYPDPPIRRAASAGERRALQTAIRFFNKAANRDRSRRFNSAAEALKYLHEERSGARDRRRWIRAASWAALLVTLTLGTFKWVKGVSPQSEIISAERIKSLPGPPGERVALEVTFNDGVKRLRKFGSEPGAALLGKFWENKPALAVGFDIGPARGKLAFYDAQELRNSSDPKPLSENYVCDPVPALWHFSDRREDCRAMPLLALDLDGIPGDELVVAANHENGCSELIVLKPGGPVIGRFWHHGWISDVRGADLDGDGKPELVCLSWADWIPDRSAIGVSNDLRKCIFVLKLSSLREEIGYWAINDWLTEGTKVSPLAYGYFLESPAGEIGFETVDARDGGLIRVSMHGNRYLELRGDLTPIKANYYSRGQPGQPPAGAPFSPDEIWRRTWPPSNKKDAKDRTARRE